MDILFPTVSDPTFSPEIYILIVPTPFLDVLQTILTDVILENPLGDSADAPLTALVTATPLSSLEFPSFNGFQLPSAASHVFEVNVYVTVFSAAYRLLMEAISANRNKK